jgi:hypothetical protein
MADGPSQVSIVSDTRGQGLCVSGSFMASLGDMMQVVYIGVHGLGQRACSTGCGKATRPTRTSHSGQAEPAVRSLPAVPGGLGLGLDRTKK